MSTQPFLARRWWINLALLAVALTLALAARWDTQQRMASTRLTAVDPGDVRAISLARAGEPAIELVRRQDRWQQTAPFAAPADAAMIDKLLPIAQARVHRTLPAAGLDLEQLGLAPAPIRLRLDGLELRFGATEPISERRYVQLGDLVHLIDDTRLPQLLAPAEDYLSKRLLPPGFSPGLAVIDGRPIGAGAVAGLADALAHRVEPLGGELSGRVLSLESADGGQRLRFLISDGGTRWSRPDQRLSLVFERPPLAELDEDPALGPLPPQPADPFSGVSDQTLLQLRPPQPQPAAGVPLLPPASAPAAPPAAGAGDGFEAPLPTEKRRP